MNCHFSLSWHCQKIQGWGWLAGAGVPTHPVEKEREVSQLAVKRVHYATEYFLVIAIFVSSKISTNWQGKIKSS